MKTQPLGSLTISRLAYGNMRTVQTWVPAEVTPERMDIALKSHIAAYEAGYTHFDTADIYCRGMCEQALGKTLKQVKGMRATITIATKCGIRFVREPKPDSVQRYDFSADHILWSCENSLKNLQVDTIDLYYLHRPDLLMQPEEVAGAFEKLKKAGKVREFGVSNFLPSTLDLLQKALPFKIAAHQIKIHPAHLPPLFDGTLDQCLSQKITCLGYSPVAGGWLGTGHVLDKSAADYESKKRLQDVVDAVADEMGVSRSVAAVAWVMKHPAKIVPIIGSNNPQHIKDAVKADEVEMTREQWYRILQASRGSPLP
jgi:predicted oxidoreductase